jgi:hypothetical protein
MSHKYIFILLIVLFSIQNVNAYGIVNTQGNITINGYNVTMIPLLYLPYATADTTNITLGLNSSIIKLDGNSDYTISDIIDIPVSPTNSTRFVFSNTGNINFYVQKTKNNFSYGLFVDGVINSAAISNSTGWMHFMYTLTGSHSISIQEYYALALISPANNSNVVNPTVTLIWNEWPLNNPYKYQIATDNQFIGIIETGLGTTHVNETISTDVNLNSGTQYFWRVKNNTGSYLQWFTFNTTTPTTTPGRFNITAFDERTLNRILIFDTQIYNSTSVVNRTTTTGWINLTAAEVSGGEYLIRITALNYASRSILIGSPGNATVYIPPTAATVDLIAFYLLDYSQLYPWTTSKIIITKNNTVMHSSYFDSDSKAAVNLIRGDSYGVTVSHDANMQNWGNYISTASGNVEVVIMNLGVNSTIRNPFVYNLTWSNTSIMLKWTDSYGVMIDINYSIYKGLAHTPVHQVETSIRHGQSEYLVTNISDVYYVYINANTNNGWRNQTYTIDYRNGVSATESESPELYNWSYGSVTIPPWVKNAFAILALAILGGSFGALHRGIGSIMVGIMALIFWKWTWLTATGAGAGFLGALVLFAILYHMEGKRKGGIY